MTETNLERYEARQAKRDEITAWILKEARKRAAQAIKSSSCRADQHDQCDGSHSLAADECLCTCHDPKTTYWVWWTEPGDGREVVGMTSGPYGTTDEAIEDGFAGSGNDGPWIRENAYITQVAEEHWDALMAWDEKTEAEKAALRPNAAGEQ